MNASILRSLWPYDSPRPWFIKGKQVLDLKGLHAPHQLPSGNLLEALRYWANALPNKVAFYYTDGETDSDQSLTYAELDHAARAVAV